MIIIITFIITFIIKITMIIVVSSLKWVPIRRILADSPQYLDFNSLLIIHYLIAF
jgi:hypothetical protein